MLCEDCEMLLAAVASAESERASVQMRTPDVAEL